MKMNASMPEEAAPAENGKRMAKEASPGHEPRSCIKEGSGKAKDASPAASPAVKVVAASSSPGSGAPAAAAAGTVDARGTLSRRRSAVRGATRRAAA